MKSKILKIGTMAGFALPVTQLIACNSNSDVQIKLTEEVTASELAKSAATKLLVYKDPTLSKIANVEEIRNLNWNGVDTEMIESLYDSIQMVSKGKKNFADEKNDLDDSGRKHFEGTYIVKAADKIHSYLMHGYEDRSEKFQNDIITEIELIENKYSTYDVNFAGLGTMGYNHSGISSSGNFWFKGHQKENDGIITMKNVLKMEQSAFGLKIAAYNMSWFQLDSKENMLYAMSSGNIENKSYNTQTLVVDLAHEIYFMKDTSGNEHSGVIGDGQAELETSVINELKEKLESRQKDETYFDGTSLTLNNPKNIQSTISSIVSPIHKWNKDSRMKQIKNLAK